VIGFVKRGEREVGLSNAWRITDGLDLTLAELLQDVDDKHARHTGQLRPDAGPRLQADGHGVGRQRSLG